MGMILEALDDMVRDESRAVEGVENCGRADSCLTEDDGDDLNESESRPVSEKSDPKESRDEIGFGSWKIADSPLGWWTGCAG